MTRRAAMLGLLSSGFLAKMLLGAVAVAAVGGVAATMPRIAPTAPFETVSTTQTLISIATPIVNPEVADTGADPDALVERVHEFSAAVQIWGECVSEAARDHSGGPFDPKASCGEAPTAADHGLADERPPGLIKAADKADDKATKTTDKTDDKATKTTDKTDDKATKTTDKADDNDADNHDD